MIQMPQNLTAKPEFQSEGLDESMRLYAIRVFAYEFELEDKALKEGLLPSWSFSFGR